MSSYAYCPDCGNKYKSFTDCLECGIPLLKPHKDNKQSVKGNNNQTNQITGSHNNITNIVSPQTETQSKTVIQRQSIKPISIAGQSINTWWFMLPGSIGIFANILQIVQFWSSGFKSTIGNTQFMTYLMLASFLLIIIGMVLRKMKYIPLVLSSWTIEIDKSQRLYFTRIGGTCGKCGDHVKVSTMGPNWETRIRCVNNPQQHAFEFDRTLLPDVGEEYQSLQD